MKKKNSKQTVKKINIDAFELRFSEEKLEIEAKSLQWKTVAGSTNYLYAYLLHLSDTPDMEKHIETQVRAMYCMASMCHNAAIVYAADNYFNLVRNAYNGTEMSVEDIDKNMIIISDMVKEHVLECVERAAEVAGEDEQDEALEDVRIMTEDDELYVKEGEK